VYVDGKLVGAVAYGWSFENEPMAGVTPIHNMLAELDRPAASRPVRTASAPPLLGAAPPPAGAQASRDDAASPRPLLTPLSLGGFSQRVIRQIAPELERFGLLPVATGGRSREPIPELRNTGAEILPGSALGVDLIRGDWNATAIGTATHVQGNRVVAFGHPFFQGGRIEAPAVLAEVHAIMSRMAVSFKMATGVAEVGAMVGDWQSCIVADTKTKARMIPVSVKVVNGDTGHDEQYALEVMDNEAFSPLLVLIAVVNAIDSATGSSQDTTVRAALTAELSDKTVQVTDTFFSPTGGLIDFRTLSPLMEMFSTPFGHPGVKRVSVNVEAALERRTAEIKRAYFTKSELERGETATLNVVLKPFRQPEITKSIPVEVPAATDSMRSLSVTVMSGRTAPADVAPPDSLDDFLDAIQKRHRSTDLVALVQSPGRGMHYRGKLLKKLPPSAIAVLDDSSTRDVAAAADVQQIVVPTDWVLTGQATVNVPIRQE
jgi:hypothetical protein